MIASASIPGGFPPTMIDVEVDGKRYQEMHVDGGTMAQVFAYPVSIRVDELAKAAGVTRERKLYVIRNARLDPDWAHVERSTMSIAGRAVASLIHTQGIGDLYRIYATAQRDGVDFNLTFIPSTFNVPHKEEFDNEYMRKLYDVGYDLAVKGIRGPRCLPATSPRRASNARKDHLPVTAGSGSAWSIRERPPASNAPTIGASQKSHSCPSAQSPTKNAGPVRGRID